MAGIRQRATSPELTTKKVVRSLGLRSSMNGRNLPGTPDLVNRTDKWAIFVHGCYWHRHKGCRAATTPSRNVQLWIDKFAANVERDQRKSRELRRLGYRVVIVWECETRKPDLLTRRLKRLLKV